MFFENDLISVSVSFDSEKVINSFAVNGEIVYLKENLIGAYCVEARPKKEGEYIEGIGIYSVCYEMDKSAAVDRAVEYIRSTM